jgi:hypothetical protein
MHVVACVLRRSVADPAEVGANSATAVADVRLDLGCLRVRSHQQRETSENRQNQAFDAFHVALPIIDSFQQVVLMPKITLRSHK